MLDMLNIWPDPSSHSELQNAEKTFTFPDFLFTYTNTHTTATERATTRAINKDEVRNHTVYGIKTSHNRSQQYFGEIQVFCY